MPWCHVAVCCLADAAGLHTVDGGKGVQNSLLPAWLGASSLPPVCPSAHAYARGRAAAQGVFACGIPPQDDTASLQTKKARHAARHACVSWDNSARDPRPVFFASRNSKHHPPMQVDMQHSSMVHSVLACAVEGCTLLVLANGAGLQVWDEAACALLYVWQLPSALAPPPERRCAAFVRGLAFTISEGGGLQLAAGCSSGTIQARNCVHVLRACAEWADRLMSHLGRTLMRHANTAVGWHRCW